MYFLRHISSMLTSAIDTNVVALDMAQTLENSLGMQKGLVTYYFVDGDPEWLNQLERYRSAFDEALRKGRGLSYTEEQRDLLNNIESKYIHYSYLRDQVISLSRAGDRDAGFRLHKEIWSQYAAIRELCDQYKGLHLASIDRARESMRPQVRLLSLLALAAVPGALFLSGLLVYFLINRILDPVRSLALSKEQESGKMRVPDEVEALSRRVHSLMEDVDHTQIQLQQSREHLLQSEKLAMVGKLAAGVAHTIRNPLTSVKMRLFSMERTLDLTPAQKEDIEVISDEIRHIDTIVRNFLEFSRPPKLKLQTVSPSDVVDRTIQLLKHRIESYGVEVQVYRQRRLQEIEVDPEQLMEVLVNLIINACDAMGEGGTIVIREEEGFAEPFGRVVVIRISDNGPGVPESIRDQVFQPFFSTKEEGTGLGLSIAARIIEDHRGCLNLRSREGKGTTFTITLPCKEDRAWLRY